MFSIIVLTLSILHMIYCYTSNRSFIKTAWIQRQGHIYEIFMTDTKKTTVYEVEIAEYEDWDSGEVPWNLKDVNITVPIIKVNLKKNISKYF